MRTLIVKFIIVIVLVLLGFLCIYLKKEKEKEEGEKKEKKGIFLSRKDLDWFVIFRRREYELKLLCRLI